MDEHTEHTLSMLKITLVSLFAFHMAMLAVVFIIAWSHEAGVYAAAAGWPWVIPGVIALAGPIAFRWRLRRVRARRAQLLQSEWMTREARSANRKSNQT